MSFEAGDRDDHSREDSTKTQVAQYEADKHHTPGPRVYGIVRVDDLLHHRELILECLSVSLLEYRDTRQWFWTPLHAFPPQSYHDQQWTPSTSESREDIRRYSATRVRTHPGTAVDFFYSSSTTELVRRAAAADSHMCIQSFPLRRLRISELSKSDSTLND